MENATPAIYPAMIAIMQSVEAIKKEKTNKQGEGFKYRGIDDVLNSLHSAFALNGVIIMPEVIERTEVERRSIKGNALYYATQRIRFNFIAVDGSSTSSTVIGTAMDSGDKADNKAMSVALKYALLQAFLIPTADMIDPDSETHEVRPSKPAMNEAQMTKALARIAAGEMDVWEKLTDALYVTAEQEARIRAAYEQIQTTKSN